MNQAGKIKHLQAFKQDRMEVVPVESKEEADYLSEGFGMSNVIYDVGGSLTKLQGSLDAGAGKQGRYRELSGPSEKSWVLRWDIKIRLCKLGLQE